jgi:nicotinate-nucleotide adenylyltransferase
MKIGLYFGSFNPMHLGHKIIASYMVEFSNLDKIMFVVSPQNPFKKKQSLLDQHQRLMIIQMEIEDNPKLQVSDIEFSMPQPSYTIDTLVRLKEKYPKNDYSLIMGSDNLQNLHKWKNYKQILKQHAIYVFPRPGFKITEPHENIHIIKEVPQMEISSSFIRRCIKKGKDISYLMPEKAWKYTAEMNLYK